MSHRFAPLLALPLLVTAPALHAQEAAFFEGVDISDLDFTQADLFVSGDTVLDDSVCIGNACVETEVFPDDTLLRLTNPDIRVEFVDNSSAAGSFPSNDWEIQINDTANFGQERFSIADATAGTVPFTIEAGAPSSALWIAPGGEVGMGTALPQTDLHVAASTLPTLRLDQVGFGAFPPFYWTLAGNHNVFYIGNSNGTGFPFSINDEAPNASLALAANGNVGLGTDSPDAPLEVSDDDTFSFFRITATEAPTNQSVDVVFTQGPLGTGEFRYNIVDGDGPEMRLNADGDMVIDGTLTTGGPTCDSGCDAVFDADFKRLSVTEHAALMWENGHLPAVGPTLPGQPMNVSEKMGAMLNELEHAHIYIE
ncbi:MAG: hypothetical protein RIA08_09295 [Roseovarius sp.]|uniref:hypothetical protein n=1 Tax=Roseobacteraceae TaxID=2854170 RepID=UPI0032ECF55D